ncbi:MAG: hypothetical protein H8E15_07515 [Planctomycetes bacterium]|nr:hypothetical protein [Planctomycetota bacterium]
MTEDRFHHLVRKIAYPTCVFSCVGFMIGMVSFIWTSSLEDQEEGILHFQVAMTCFVLAFGYAMALGATASAKNSK